MNPKIDLSFLEQFSDLEIVKNFLIEENNGNRKNRKKLKHAIINIRLQTGKMINQRIFLDGNSIMVSHYAGEIKRCKMKSIVFTLYCSFVVIALSIDEARRILFEYIEVFYNRIRPQKRLGYLSPVQWLKQWQQMDSKLVA